MKKLASLALALTLVFTLAVTAFAAPVKLDGVTLSAVTSTEKKTIKIRGKSESVTLYHVPKDCIVTFDKSGWFGYYNGTNGDYNQSGGGSAQAGEKMTFEYVHGEYTQLNGGSTTYHIIVGGSASSSGSSTTKAPAASTEKATTQKPSSSATADKDTVKVAGQDRTPGQVQTLRSGDYIYTIASGDTLYALAARFYGDGGLWRELQKANQKYLAEAKDGTIFVGFNLLIPDELGGVRANIG